MGFTRIDVSPTQLVVSYISAASGNVIDQFSIVDSVLPEVSVQAIDGVSGERGNDPGVFSVTLTGLTTSPLNVSFALGGTAQYASDYEPVPLIVTIPAGQASATVTIAPINDIASEGPESVSLQITPSVEYNIALNPSNTLTIQDDEIIEVTLDFSRDTQLHQINPSTNYFNSTTLRVDGNDAGGAVQNTDSFQFPLRIAPGMIPPNAVSILDATLQLRVSNGGDALSLHRLLSPWPNTATWAERVKRNSSRQRRSPHRTGCSYTVDQFRDHLNRRDGQLTSLADQPFFESRLGHFADWERRRCFRFGRRECGSPVDRPISTRTFGFSSESSSLLQSIDQCRVWRMDQGTQSTRLIQGSCPCFPAVPAPTPTSPITFGG